MRRTGVGRFGSAHSHRSREFKDADQREQDLRAAGVRVDIPYLESGKQCEKNRGQSVQTPDGLSPCGRAGWNIKPQLIGKDKTLVLEFAGNQDDEMERPVTGRCSGSSPRFWSPAMSGRASSSTTR